MYMMRDYYEYDFNYELIGPIHTYYENDTYNFYSQLSTYDSTLNADPVAMFILLFGFSFMFSWIIGYFYIAFCNWYNNNEYIRIENSPFEMKYIGITKCAHIIANQLDNFVEQLKDNVRNEQLDYNEIKTWIEQIVEKNIIDMNDKFESNNDIYYDINVRQYINISIQNLIHKINSRFKYGFYQMQIDENTITLDYVYSIKKSN